MAIGQLKSKTTIQLKNLWFLLRKIVIHFNARFYATYAFYATGFILHSAPLIYIAVIFWPSSININYSQPSCLTSYVLMPNYHNFQQSNGYSANFANYTKVGGYPILAQSICVEPTSIPKTWEEQKIQFAPFANPLLKKNIYISADTLPQLANQNLRLDLISIEDDLVFNMNLNDILFDYVIQINDQEIMCSKSGSSISCPIKDLGLTQSGSYNLKLIRFYKNEPGDVILEQKVTTVSAITIKKSSLSDNSIAYQQVSDIEIQTNKNIQSVEDVSFNQILSDGQNKPNTFTITHTKDKITISFAQNLPRQSVFELKIKSIKAEDKGTLNKPYSLTFKTSGGPQVSGVNIGTYAVNLNQNFQIYFDVGLSKNQVLKDFASVTVNDQKIPANISLNNKTISINPTSNLSPCTKFTINIKKGLISKYDIGGGSSWSYNSRTLCQTVSIIGTSVEGRNIYAYRFGSGSNKIIFVGATHGNEYSSKYILNSWIEELEANFDRIPKNRSIIIVPTLNPDGISKGQRTNANNVDLNRNYPANDWKSDVTLPDGTLIKNGGGDKPLSEPESNAIAKYVLANDPKLVLTYHSQASVVIANESGNSSNLANEYGKLSGYRSLTDGASDGLFNYDTTGAFENWLHDKYEIPALLIELSTNYTNEFYIHKHAMWAMISF